MTSPTAPTDVEVATAWMLEGTYSQVDRKYGFKSGESSRRIRALFRSIPEEFGHILGSDNETIFLARNAMWSLLLFHVANASARERFRESVKVNAARHEASP